MSYVAFMGAPVAAAAALALLNFDAWPLVDDVSPNVVSVEAWVDSADVVATPTVGSSSGALKLHDFGNNGQALDTSPNGWDIGTALTETAYTVEFFLRRDGSTSLGGSSGWSVNVYVQFYDATWSENSELLLDIYNVPTAPTNGQARLFAYLDGWPHYSDGNYIEAYDLPDSEFTHIAAVVDGMNLSVYAGGVRIINETLLGTGFPSGLTFIGASVSQYTYSGETAPRYIDSVRVSDGALYSGASFTPPTAQLTE